MKLHRQTDTRSNFIQAYDAGGFVVQGTHHGHGILVGADWLVSPWGPEMADQLGAEHFSGILEHSPEILIVGTGQHQKMLLSLTGTLRQHTPAVEIMDSRAACRTYNILLAEDRQVVAALLPVLD